MAASQDLTAEKKGSQFGPVKDLAMVLNAVSWRPFLLLLLAIIIITTWASFISGRSGSFARPDAPRGDSSPPCKLLPAAQMFSRWKVTKKKKWKAISCQDYEQCQKVGAWFWGLVIVAAKNKRFFWYNLLLCNTFTGQTGEKYRSIPIYSEHILAFGQFDFISLSLWTFFLLCLQ